MGNVKMSKMKSRKQLISIRLEPWMIEVIDNVSCHNPLWSRSKVVSKLLQGVLSSRNSEELAEIVSLPHLLSKGYMRSLNETENCV